MDILQNTLQEFINLIGAQRFDSKKLKHEVAANHIKRLKQLSELSNSSVMVFDLHKLKPILTLGFYGLMRNEGQQPDVSDVAFLNKYIHPDDSLTLVRLWAASLKLCYSLPAEERKNYKMVFDYRIKMAQEHYTRIIEQYQVLELDPLGNIWLGLGLVDISPDQDMKDGVRYSIVNFKTGELMGLPEVNKQPAPFAKTTIKLSDREKEILALVKDGLLSKEIAEKLSLSVHTVNTHRQRILSKLNANTSLEAIKYATELGLQ
jgi:DNA-binding CsgD family transcriptional regulator